MQTLYFESMRKEDKRQYIVQHYNSMFNTEMANALGCSISSVRYHIGQMGLLRSAEDNIALIERAKAKRRIACAQSESYKSRGDKLKKLYRSELRQALVCQPQKTDIRVSLVPRHISRARYNLIARYGYKPCATDPYGLWRDEKTRRVNEKYYTEKYKLTFYE